MKKSMFRLAMVMVMVFALLAGTVCCAYAADENQTTQDGGKGEEKNDGSLDYLKNKDTDVLNEQTESFQKTASGIYKFLLMALNGIGVIALIVIGIVSLFGLGEPQTKQKLKSSAMTIIIILIIGNGAVNIVYWGIRLAQSIF